MVTAPSFVGKAIFSPVVTDAEPDGRDRETLYQWILASHPEMGEEQLKSMPLDTVRALFSDVEPGGELWDRITILRQAFKKKTNHPVVAFALADYVVSATKAGMVERREIDPVLSKGIQESKYWTFPFPERGEGESLLESEIFVRLGAAHMSSLMMEAYLLALEIVMFHRQQVSLETVASLHHLFHVLEKEPGKDD